MPYLISGKAAHDTVAAATKYGRKVMKDPNLLLEAKRWTESMILSRGFEYKDRDTLQRERDEVQFS